MNTALAARTPSTLVVIATLFLAFIAGASVNRFQSTLLLAPISIIVAPIVVKGLIWARSLVLAPTKDEPDNEMDLQGRFSLTAALYYAGLFTAGVLIVRPALGLALSDFVFFLALALVFARLLISREDHLTPLPLAYLVGVTLFVTGALISSTASPQPLQSILNTTKFAYLALVWVILTMTLVKNSARLRAMILVWTAGMALSSAFALLQFLGVVHTANRHFEQGRALGLTGHPNDLGAQAAIALIPALVLVRLANPRTAERAVATLVLVLLMLGLLLSQSVNAAIVAAAGVVAYVLVTIGVSLSSALRVVTVVGALVLGFSLLSSQIGLSALSRFESTTNVNDEYCTICSRFATNEIALQERLKQPLVGAGLDSVGKEVAGTMSVHNLILKAWYEAGLLGIVGMLLLIGSILIILIANVQNATRSEDRAMATALLFAVLVFLGISMNQPILYQRYGWIPVALSLAQYQQLRNMPPRAH